MGSFHCIPTECGRVYYRQYLPPSVVYQYPNEAEKIIEGDAYTLEEKLPTNCPGKPHQFKYRYANQFISDDEGNCDLAGYSVEYIRNVLVSRSEFPLRNFRFLVNNNLYAEAATADDWLNEDGTSKFDHWSYRSEGNNPCGEPPYGNSKLYQLFADTTTRTNVRLFQAQNFGVQMWDYSVVPNAVDADCPKQCEFTVYKQGEIVHQETRNDCPQVEQIDCKLSDERKVIEIEKLAYLERIEVIDWAYQNYLGLLNPDDYGLLVVRQDIPPECRNIYKNTTVTAIPLPGVGVGLSNTGQEAYNHIEQICSAVGCPPPEYQVICNCDCRECPPKTCPVKCTGHVCCYDTSTGIAVESIPIAEYCENPL